MTNLIATAALITLWIGGVQAQTSIILTPEIGIQTSKIKLTGDLDFSEDYQGMDVTYSGIFSYQGGVGVGIQFFDHWGLITGFKYNRKGGKVTVETRNPNNPFLVTMDDGTQTTDVGEFTQTTTHNWLSIPILARGQFGGGSITFGLAIGPQINLGIGQYKLKTEYDLENVSLGADEETFDYGKKTTDVLKKSHISLLILPSVGYKMNDKSSLKFSMMIESSGDMLNDNYVVADNNGGTSNIDATYRNTQIGIMLGYEYKFNLEAGVKY